ncbi:MAG: tyrosine-type recombinase/integrase [Burkholderiaceae bacterium]|nr:tyrosine-type recombinase/integrase [Burkholderiaceae bacterium]
MPANLTVTAIAALKKKEKPYSVRVSRGLRIRVAISGIKTWMVQYVVKGGDGKQHEYWLPKPWGNDTNDGHLSLADARSEADKIRALARDGIDYQDLREQEVKAKALRLKTEQEKNKSVYELFDAWIKTCKRKDGGAELRRSFTKNVFPFIGTKPLNQLIEADITELLQVVVDRGSHRTSLMLRNNLQQMMIWGQGRQPWKALIIDNPVVNIKPADKIFSGYDNKGRDRTLSPDEIAELAIKLPTAGLTKSVEILIWIMLSCCTRIGETTKAKWEHMNLDNAIWKIPGADTKNGIEHTVYLSNFAVSNLKKLRDLSFGNEWCFPQARGTNFINPKNATKQIRDRQMSAMNRKNMANRTKFINALVLSCGDWVPHDLRRTGATMMQSLGVTPEVIERILNHTEQDKLKKIYHQYDYAKEKREAWRLLGERLDLLTRQEINVPVLNRAQF